MIIVKSAQYGFDESQMDDASDDFDEQYAPQFRSPVTGKPDFYDVDVRRLDGQLHDSKEHIDKCIEMMGELLETNPNIPLHEVIKMFNYEFQMIIPFHEYLNSGT